MTGKIP